MQMRTIPKRASIKSCPELNFVQKIPRALVYKIPWAHVYKILRAHMSISPRSGVGGSNNIACVSVEKIEFILIYDFDWSNK